MRVVSEKYKTKEYYGFLLVKFPFFLYEGEYDNDINQNPNQYLWNYKVKGEIIVFFYIAYYFWILIINIIVQLFVQCLTFQKI